MWAHLPVSWILIKPLAPWTTCTNVIHEYFPRYELFSNLIFGLVQTGRRTESDAYEPTVQIAQVGSKIEPLRHLNVCGRKQVAE